MRVFLHILTKANDTLTVGVMETQQKRPDVQVEVVDLTGPEPDYIKLLEAIFAADSIAVW